MPRPSSPSRFVLPPQLWRLRPLQLATIDLLDWLFPWVAVNLLWLLASLTLVLLPPATAALFDLAQAAYRNQRPTPRRFLAGLRRWFGLSWRWAAPNGLLLGGLFLLGRAVAPAEIPLALVGVLAAAVVLGQFFFWPYMVLQDEPKLLRALRNSVFTALGDLPYFALYLAITFFILIPSVVVIAPLLLITPVLLSLLTTYGLAAWLERQGLLTGETRDV
jgi:uncharacterized membrane protein YesL